MRHRAASVEQSRLGQQEGAGADRADAASLLGTPRDPADERALMDGGARAETAHRDQRVDRLGGERAEPAGGEAKARRGRDLAALGRDHAQTIGLGEAGLRREVARAGEDLERAGDIEQQRLFEGDEDDVAHDGLAGSLAENGGIMSFLPDAVSGRLTVFWSSGETRP
jgi:hypothetical protein